MQDTIFAESRASEFSGQRGEHFKILGEMITSIDVAALPLVRFGFTYLLCLEAFVGIVYQEKPCAIHLKKRE